MLQSGRNLREPPSGFPKKKCYIGDFQGSKGKPLSGLWKPRLISKKWAKLVEMTPRHRSLKLLTSDTSGECLHVPYRSLAGFQWGNGEKRRFSVAGVLCSAGEKLLGHRLFKRSSREYLE